MNELLIESTKAVNQFFDGLNESVHGVRFFSWRWSIFDAMAIAYLAHSL